jgi:hypothetical protein
MGRNTQFWPELARPAGLEPSMRTVDVNPSTVGSLRLRSPSTVSAQRREPKIFEDVLEFARVVPLYDVQITVLTAFPGTPLYDRRMREGPLLESGRWDLCTLFDVNYRPEGMSPEHLKEGAGVLCADAPSPPDARSRPR